MKVVFLGVGEAFDENQPNTSILVESETKLLLDCGYSSVTQLWKYNPDPEFIDAVYITHQHADHFLGLPSLMTRMWKEEKRKKPLKIICQKGLEEKIKEAMDLCYLPLFTIENKYPIEFIEVEEGQTLKLNELKLEFAKTEHFRENLAIKVTKDSYNVCFGGDGHWTEESEKMYNGCDLLIHEGYFFQQGQKHLYIPDVIEMAERNNVKCFALVHINRDTRKNEMNRILKVAKESKIKVIVPEAMDEYNF